MRVTYRNYLRHDTVPKKVIVQLKKLTLPLGSVMKEWLIEESGHHFVVAFVGNTAIGWSVVADDCVSVFVDAKWRKRGIGQKLLERQFNPRWGIRDLFYFWPAKELTLRAAKAMGYKGKIMEWVP